MEIGLIFLIIFGAAIIAGALGMGGGILSIPLLMLVLNKSGEHSFIKLIAYIGIISLALSSLYKYLKQGRKPLWVPAFLMIIGVITTSIIMNWYFHNHPLPTKYFNLGYAIVVLIIILLVSFNKRIPRFNIPIWVVPIIGFGIGAIGGTFGLSGGVLFVPAFTILFGQKMKNAAISSVLCKIAMATSAIITLAISGTFAIVPLGNNNWWLLGIIPIALIAGYLGAIINLRLPNKYFKLIFVILLLGILVLKITLSILEFI